MSNELTFSTSQLEAVARALGHTDDGLTGSEIGHLLATARIDDTDPGITKWTRLFNAFVNCQNRLGHRRNVLAFIRFAMKPDRFAHGPERFEPIRANLNRALAFVGLEVREDGELVESARASTLPDAIRRANELRAGLSSRGVHADVLAFCRSELVADNYFHAVLEATKSVAAKLRISEQRGFANLVKGMFGMFRNTTAHAPKLLWNMSKQDAEDLLTVASLIHRRLPGARGGSVGTWSAATMRLDVSELARAELPGFVPEYVRVTEV